MTIEITRPEIATRIQQRLQSGRFHDIDELLTKALDALIEKENAAAGPLPVAAPVASAKNLVSLFADSPFKGLNMDFERGRDTGRDVER